jgi:hypothetical protein
MSKVTIMYKKDYVIHGAHRAFWTHKDALEKHVDEA